LSKVERPGIENLIEFLANSSFYEDPASAKYHSAFDGGLVSHSLKVYNVFIGVLNMFNYMGLPEKSKIELPIIVSLLHDLCKTGRYNVRLSWRKDAKDKWESYPSYEHVNDPMPMGHATKSICMIKDFIVLTPEEEMCIYWHMGPSTTANINDFYSAAIACPLVSMFHSADVIASTTLESQGGMEELIKKDRKIWYTNQNHV